MNSKRCYIFPRFFWAPAGAIFRGMNIKITNKKMSQMHLFKEWEEEQVGGKFMKEKNFTGGKRKNCQVKC